MDIRIASIVCLGEPIDIGGMWIPTGPMIAVDAEGREVARSQDGVEWTVRREPEPPTPPQE